MPRTEAISSLETLAPLTAADRHVLYTLVRDELNKLYPTRTEVVKRLALIAVRHLQGEGQRVLIRGPHEAEKEEVVRALARVLDLPFIEIDVSALAETNWTGSDLPFFLGQLRTGLAERFSLFTARLLAERACILVSGLDQARLGTSYGSAATRDHRAGKQAALAQLLQRGPVPVSGDRGRESFIWRGHQALVIATAEFRELQQGHISSTDLVSWGMLPELADSIANAVFIGLGPLSKFEIEHRLRDGVNELVAQFLQFGYHLKVDEHVIRYITRIVADGTYGSGAANGLSWIAASAEAALIRMLDTNARAGTIWVIARDDISLPERPRGVWRE